MMRGLLCGIYSVCFFFIGCSLLYGGNELAGALLFLGTAHFSIKMWESQSSKH